MPTSWNENTKRNLVDYLISFEYLHSLYVFRYFLCEFLNFLNSVSIFVQSAIVFPFFRVFYRVSNCSSLTGCLKGNFTRTAFRS